jgi:hypothetical protein
MSDLRNDCDPLVMVPAGQLRPGMRIMWQRGLTQKIVDVRMGAGRVRVTFERPVKSRWNPNKTLRLQSHHSPADRVCVVGPVALTPARRGWFKRKAQ